MKKALFLSIILSIITISCAQKPARNAQDCEFTCATIAEDHLSEEVRGCICQEKEKYKK